MILFRLTVFSFLICLSFGAVADWWEHAVFYQIYPRSFKDSNNDGIGDVKGIIEKVPYLASLGITGIWLSPIYKSTNVDQGYDISDYRDIDPDYGTLDDVKNLIQAVHKQRLKLILDYVPNHTSHEHEWFVKSEKNDTEYKDFYVWKNGKNNNQSLPNNWVSAFNDGQPAWKWSNQRQQYYLHHFTWAQPDLNYTNPRVRQAMKDVLTYWMDLGVDGFRIDAINLLAESDYDDEPLLNTSQCLNQYRNYSCFNHTKTQDQPLTYEVLHEWRELVDNYTQKYNTDQKILMAEVYSSLENTIRYYVNNQESEAHFPFNFFLITNLTMNSTAKDIANVINTWLNAVPPSYTSNWVLGNHDQRRVATRLGPKNSENYNMLTAILPGIMVTYNGEEIGMEDVYVPYDQGKDPAARNESTYNDTTRDFQRTPFQWDNTTNCGFNNGTKPWLPAGNCSQNNVKEEESNDYSHLSIYKQLINLRRTEPFAHLLQVGSTNVQNLGDEVLVVARNVSTMHIVLVSNIGDKEQNLDLTEYLNDYNTVLIGSSNSKYTVGDQLNVGEVNLDGHESIVVYMVTEQL